MEKKKGLIWAVISLLIAAMSVFAVIKQSRDMSIIKIFQSLENADIRFVILAIISSFGFIFFEGLAIMVVAKSLGYKKSIFKGCVYSSADICFSAITPSASGGQPASAYLMIKDGISAAVTTVTLIVNLIMYTLALLTVGAVALIIDREAITRFALFPARVLIGVGCLVLIGLFISFMLLLRHGKWVFKIVSKIMVFLSDHHMLHHLPRRLAKLERIVYDYEEAVVLMRGKVKALILAYIFNLLQRISQILASALLYCAYFGCGKNAFKIFTTQVLAMIGSFTVPIPGGMGVTDYLTIDGFASIVGREQAIFMDLISRGVSFYVLIVVTVVILILGVFIVPALSPKKHTHR